MPAPPLTPPLTWRRSRNFGFEQSLAVALSLAVPKVWGGTLQRLRAFCSLEQPVRTASVGLE